MESTLQSQMGYTDETDGQKADIVWLKDLSVSSFLLRFFFPLTSSLPAFNLHHVMSSQLNFIGIRNNFIALPQKAVLLDGGN